MKFSITNADPQIEYPDLPSDGIIFINTIEELLALIEKYGRDLWISDNRSPEYPDVLPEITIIDGYM